MMSSRLRLLCRLAVMALAVSLSACERSTEPVQRATELPAAAVNVEWARFVDDFIESYLQANPAFAASMGRHEFDGRLNDFSREALARQVEDLERSRTLALDFTDETLLPEERFQRDYLLSRIEEDLFWLREMRAPFKQPHWYMGAGLDPSLYVSVPYAPAESRLRAFIKYARQLPQAATQIKDNLELPLPDTYIDHAVASFGGLAQFYRDDVPAAFQEVQDEQVLQDLQDVLPLAIAAMTELAGWFETQRATATDDFALGPQRFAAMLRMTEGVDVPLERLLAIGQQDLQRNLAALAQACEQLAADAPIEECVAQVSADKPEGGAVSGARAQLSMLKAFILERDVVTIPGIEEALVEEAPAYARQNFAYIQIPGPYEKALPSVYYIAPPDPSWSPQERDAYLPGRADLLFTTIHEVWPGHFLQFLHSNRTPWRFGQLFVGYAFAEGWAHYAEELLIEHGIAASAPDLQVGQLLNALLRNVRYLCAIGLHTQGMTVAECEQMFREQAYQDPGNARQQAARGTHDPAYLNYTLGKLMIRKLRDDWTASRGGRAAWKQFNDEFLSFGGPPIPLVRQRMLGGEIGALLAAPE